MASTSHKQTGHSLISQLEALKPPSGGRSLDDLLANAAMGGRFATSQVEGNLEKLFSPAKSEPRSAAEPARDMTQLASAVRASREAKPLNSFAEVKRHASSAASVVLLKVPAYEYGEHAVGRLGRPLAGEIIDVNLTFGRTPERAEMRRHAGHDDDFTLKKEASGFVLICGASGKVYRNVEVFAREK